MIYVNCMCKNEFAYSSNTLRYVLDKSRVLE